MKSYGAITETLIFLEPIEQLKMQRLNKWWYNKGLRGVQMRIKVPGKTVYLTFHYSDDSLDKQVFAYNK